MSEQTTPDPQSYGIFQEWDGNGYYVDGRLTRNQARHLACEEDCGWYRDTTALRVWMRDCDSDEARDRTEGWSDSYFVECPKADPRAVAMWKVTVAR